MDLDATQLPPRALQQAVYVWFLLFGVVLFEPAPFDLLFAPFLFLTFMYNRIHVPGKPGWLPLWIALFAIANVLPLSVSADLGRALFFMAITLYMLLFGAFVALLVYNFGERLLDTIMSAYVAAAVFSALIGIAAMAGLVPAFLLEHVTAYEATRAKALFKDPNVYAPFLVLALVYALDKLWRFGSAWSRWLAAVFALTLGLLVSFSRAAWGAALFSVVMYFFLTAAAERKLARFVSGLAVLVLLLIAGAAVVGFFAQELNVSEFIETRLSFQRYDQDRFAVQKQAILEGFKRPLGIGPGQSETYFIDYIGHGQMTGATHSLYVRVLSELGLLGAFSFLCLLVLTVWRALWLCFAGAQAQRSQYCVFATALFATLVNSLVIDSLHWRHFFLVIGIIWGLAAREKLLREHAGLVSPPEAPRFRDGASPSLSR